MINKTLLTSFIVGTAFELYEFTIFGMLATSIAWYFFSGFEESIRLNLIFITFAIGFFIRPVGALLYGQWGDSKGRKSPFYSTIIVMTVSTFMIGLLPGYEEIGIWSVILLLFLRILQGLAVSGEYAGALTMLYEHSSLRTATLYTSLSLSGVYLGMLLASLTIVFMTYVLGESSMQMWGWRIPFLLSILLGCLGIYIRNKILESPEFLKLQSREQNKKFPLKQLLSNYKTNIIILILIFQLSIVLAYTTFIYLPNARILYFPDEYIYVYLINTINLFFIIILIPFFAKYVTSLKTKQLMALSVLILVILIFGIFYLSNLPSLVYFFIAQFLLSFLGASFAARFPYMLSKTFPVDMRYSGNGLVLNISSALFGGITPFFLNLIHQLTNSSLMPAIYVIFCSIVVLISLAKLKYID